MNIRPLFDNVLVERANAPEKSKGGLLLPSASSEKPPQGKVVATGNGEQLKDGKVRPLNVTIGETVVFNNFDASEITIDGKKLLILKEKNILGIIES